MAGPRRDPLIARALLSVALFVGFWALGLALVAGLAAIPVAQALYGDGPELGGVLGGVLAAVVAWAMRPRLGKGGEAPQALAPERFPALFAFVEEVARRSGRPAPDVVHLSMRANASIGVRRRLLGLRRTRVLELGFPFFAFLDRDALASVVAHELGHERGGDVALGAWVHRTRAAVTGTVEALDDSAFGLDAPFRLYARLFLRVSGAVSRGQELAADACAVSVAGAEATARALRRIAWFSPRWEAYFALDAVPLLERGLRVPLVDGFRRFLAAPAPRADVVEAIASMRAQPPDPTDTHPPTDERVRAILGAGDECAASTEALDLGPGCLELLGGAEAGEAGWAAQVYTQTPPVVGWADVAADALLPALVEELRGTPLDPDATPLEALPRLVADAADVWTATARGVNLLSPAARRERGLGMIRTWLAAALVRRGFRVELRPGAELVARRGAVEVEPGALVRACAEGAETEASWRARCAEWAREAA